VDFEWDEAKNRANIRKHGFDFRDAWEVFEGPMLVEPDSGADYGEDRWIGTGLLRGCVVLAVFTRTAPGTIRIISFRRAERYERIKYEEEIAHGLGES